MTKGRLRGLVLEARRYRVFQAWSQGKSQLDIAADEKVHHVQIARDLASVWRQMAGRDPGAILEDVVELLGKLAHQESELLAAWDRSKRPRNRNKAKTVRGSPKKSKPGEQAEMLGAIKRTDAEKVTEERDGDPRFMQELTKLRELMAKLRGLLVAKFAPTDPTGQREYAGPNDAQRLAALRRLYTRLGLMPGEADHAELGAS